MLTPVVTPPHSWVRSFGPARRRFGDVLIHPDGKRLIAAEDDGTVTVYRLDDGAELLHLPALLSNAQLDDARYVRLRLHPDRVRLFVTVVIIDTSDVTMCWNLERGDLVESYDYPFVPHAFVGDDLALSTNGLWLVLWDLAATKPLKRTLREDASWRLYGTLGEHALVGGRTTVELWNAREGSMRWSVPKEHARGAAMLGDLAVLAAPGRIELRNLAGEVIRDFACPALTRTDDDWYVHITDNIAVIEGAAEDLLAINLATGAIESRFTQPGRYLELRAAHGYALVWSSTDYVAAVWHLATGECRLRVPSELEITISPNGDTVIACDDNRLRVWRVDGREHLKAPLPARETSSVDLAKFNVRTKYPRVLAVEADERRVAIACEDTIELWRGGSEPMRLHTFRSLTRPTRAAFDATRRWLVSGHSDGALLVRDTIERKHHATLQAHHKPIMAIAIDGVRVAASSEDGVSLWDLERGAQLGTWSSDDDVIDLAWTDDSTLACTTGNGLVILKVNQY